MKLTIHKVVDDTKSITNTYMSPFELKVKLNGSLHVDMPHSSGMTYNRVFERDQWDNTTLSPEFIK